MRPADWRRQLMSGEGEFRPGLAEKICSTEDHPRVSSFFAQAKRAAIKACMGPGWHILVCRSLGGDAVRVMKFYEIKSEADLMAVLRGAVDDRESMRGTLSFGAVLPATQAWVICGRVWDNYQLDDIVQRIPELAA